MARAALASTRPVRRSADSDRIFALPRRTEVTVHPDYFERWRKTPGGLGNLDLRPKQAQVLYELAQYGGAMASLALGEGKTGVALLAGTVLGARCSVYLVPPALYVQVTELEYAKWAEHWQLPELGTALHVVKYTDLSSSIPKKHNVLERLAPDLVICDEAHTISRPNVRTRRLRRYTRRAKPRLLPMSGSFMDHTIREPAPLAAEALGAGSPYPRTYADLEAWSWALDDVPEGITNAPPGVLHKLVEPGAVGTLDEVRDGFRRWVAATPGFVVSTGDSCGAALTLRSRPLSLPAKVAKALDDLRRLWVRPDGVELVSPLEFHRCAATLALGFYLRWKSEPPRHWLEARSAWASELGAFLRSKARPGLDSPALVTEGAATNALRFSSYEQWAAVEKDFEPKGEAVWVDNFAVANATEWAWDRTQGPGIVWAENPAFGARVAELAGVPWYGGGTHPEIDERGGARSFVASVSAHHEGKNLQFMSRALITTPGSGARRLGQTIGRVHRQRQSAAEVVVDFYLHTSEYQAAMVAARKNADFLQRTAGEMQKLSIGTWGG